MVLKEWIEEYFTPLGFKVDIKIKNCTSSNILYLVGTIECKRSLLTYYIYSTPTRSDKVDVWCNTRDIDMDVSYKDPNALDCVLKIIQEG